MKSITAVSAWQIYKAFFIPAVMFLKDSLYLQALGSRLFLIAVQLEQQLLVILKHRQKEITSAAVNSRQSSNLLRTNIPKKLERARKGSCPSYPIVIAIHDFSHQHTTPAPRGTYLIAFTFSFSAYSSSCTPLPKRLPPTAGGNEQCLMSCMVIIRRGGDRGLSWPEATAVKYSPIKKTQRCGRGKCLPLPQNTFGNL